ncbi:hypothetical protein JTB14_013990 [Gonioctena quinquepunctata]|nr:hypothetical protein JTB14_013990 [Gonioctena quinquepunctata]
MLGGIDVCSQENPSCRLCKTTVKCFMTFRETHADSAFIIRFPSSSAHLLTEPDSGGAVGGDGDDGDDKEKEEEAERERLEAIREAEERRKEKHRKMEEEREKMRQEIRDKVSQK